MPRLYVLSGEDLGRTYEVRGGPVVLGRVADLRIRGASISRRHARLEEDGGSWSLVDLDSRNGIFKGGVRQERISLEDGDVFVLGEVELRFRLEGEAAPSEPASSEPASSEPAAEDITDTPDPGSSTGGIELEIQEGGGSAAPSRSSPAAPSGSSSDGGDDDGGELELEGDWSDEPAPVPEAPASRGAARGVPSTPKGASAADEAAAPPKPKEQGRGARQAAARAAALGSAGTRGERASSSGRPILQYSRIEDRGGGFLSSDLSQQPFLVRMLVTTLLLALGAGLLYGAYRLTLGLRGDPVEIPAEYGDDY